MITPTMAKPAYGDPCNGCGLCCIAEQCPLSEAVFGKVTMCPAIKQTGLKIICALADDPESFMPLYVERFGAKEVKNAVLLLIGSGEGCDGCAEGEIVSPEIHSAMREKAIKKMGQVNRACEILGVCYRRKE